MEMIVLGSSGWIPHDRRMTTALAVRTEGALFLFDAGTGVARLREPRFRRLIPQGGPIYILLSHLHLDHLSGLTFLPALLRDHHISIYAPVTAKLNRSGDALHELVGPPFFPHTFSEFPMPVEVKEMEPGRMEVGGLDVEVRDQHHPGGSVGFRIEDKIAFLTDTAYDREAADFVQGVEVLMHEAWLKGEGDPEELRAGLSAHTSAEDAARLADEAQVGELLLCHLPPFGDEAYYVSMLEHARRIFPFSCLAEDGLIRLL